MKVMNDIDKVNRKIKKVVLIILIVFIGLLAAFGGYLLINSLPVNSKDNKEISFVVETGSGKYKIINDLKKEGLIKNVFVGKILVKFIYKDNFLAGEHKLSKSMSLSDILEELVEGTNIEKNQVAITFIEGKRFVEMVDTISKNLKLDKEEIIKTCEDKEYLNTLIDKYWFLTDEILKDGVYNPLEGYLFPDTYFIKRDATIKEVIETLLNGMNSKLEPYKEYITTNNLDITSLLTLASVIELEAAKEADRKEIAGVFNNRIKSNMSIGSDVTTYYAVKKELGTSLTQSDINSCNAYNTRGTCTKGIPVGPICSPSIMSIEASIYPNTNDYLYFVADSKGDVHYNKTENEHINTVNELKNKGLWS